MKTLFLQIGMGHKDAPPEGQETKKSMTNYIGGKYLTIIKANHILENTYF